MKCAPCWVKNRDEVYYSYTPYPESGLWNGPSSLAEKLLWEPTLHPGRAQIEVRVIHGYDWENHEVDEEFDHFDSNAAKEDGHLYFARRRREGEEGRLDVFPEEYKRKQLSRLTPEELARRFCAVVRRRYGKDPEEIVLQEIRPDEKINYILTFEEHAEVSRGGTDVSPGGID